MYIQLGMCRTLEEEESLVVFHAVSVEGVEDKWPSFRHISTFRGCLRDEGREREGRGYERERGGMGEEEQGSEDVKENPKSVHAHSQ